MEFVFNMLYLFVFGALAGWVLELVYRSIVSKKLINPGLLNGPWLPIYGFGVVVLYLVCELNLDAWGLAILCVVLMTLIEYIAGLIFIKGLKIKLWDYSDRWGNIQGLICPLFSLFWGVLGVLYSFLIYPNMKAMLNYLSTNLYFLFVLGIFIGIFLVDFGKTMEMTQHISAKVRESQKRIALSFENLKIRIQDELKSMQKRRNFILQLKKDNGIDDIIDKQIMENEARANEKELAKLKKKAVEAYDNDK